MITLHHARRWITAGAALAAIALFAAGCGTASETGVEESARDEYGVTGSVAAPSKTGDAYLTAEQEGTEDRGTVQDAQRMIIRSKTLRLEVESTTEAIEDLRAMVKTYDGMIQDLQVATDTDDWLYRYDESGSVAGDGAALRGWVTVRIPADSFDAFIDEATTLGEVKFQAEDSEDVTQQHVDMSARLTNLRAEEERLREFFDAAKDVEDMLAIETELNRVRQEIESLDAQVKFLERQAAMATVTIELTEPRPVVRPQGDDWGFADAITSGIRGAADVLTFLIAFVIGSAPLWIGGLIIFFIVRAIIRSKKKRADTSATPQAPADDQQV